MGDTYDDLKYKFNFSKVPMIEFMTAGSLAVASQANPALAHLSNEAMLVVMRKASATPVEEISADMLGIFVKEFNEAMDEWSKEIGLK